MAMKNTREKSSGNAEEKNYSICPEINGPEVEIEQHYYICPQTIFLFGNLPFPILNLQI